MRYQPAPLSFRRGLAALLSLLLGLGPLATPAYAGLTPLADEPLNIKNQAKPNIVLTVDDSTSMLYDFLPDYVVSKYCRDGSGAMNAPCGYSGSPANAGPGGQYVSPQYVWEQPAVAARSTAAAPFPSYATGAGAVPASFSPQLFSNSGPGAGCNLSGAPPTCTGGIDPGALPGIASYAINSGSPQAGLPYEYWLLWPAPAHNSALNHMYYNPRLSYDPPVYPDTSSYPQMDGGNTSNWTKVRADPFSTSDPLDCSTEPCVDLTANVIVGQWCNSDWTQGNDDGGLPFVTNPGHCRNNGLIAAASDGSPAAIGDYMYPWAPPGITPNSVTSKVDTSGQTPWNSASPVNATIKPAWAGAQDTKYFYENDNVLWCDTTSPDWPQTGPTVPQTCQGITNPQTCTPNATQPSCGGAAGGTCSGQIPAGTCNGYIAAQDCTGFSAGNCTGFQAGACNGQPGVCTGPAAGTCNNAPLCNGAVAATCNGSTREACVGGTPAACNNITPDTCNGGTQKTCNPVAQTCNGAGAQTCVNIHSIPPDPSTCTSDWDPPGCNINPDPEGTCVFKTTCPPPTFAGNCSIQTGKVCTADADCPFINGTCSVAGNSCASDGDCNLKRCQGAASGSCNVDTDCPISGGTCAKTGQACTINAGVSTCPAAGNCNNPPFAVCTSNPGSCPAISANCATTTSTSCPAVQANSPACPVVPNSGTCNNPPNAACTTSATCPAIGNTCKNAGPNTGNACATFADCGTPGTCSNSGAACNANSNCVAVGPSTCQAGSDPAKIGMACATNTDCQLVGTCTNSKSLGNACTTAAQCTVGNTCANAGPNFGLACGSVAFCQVTGTCPAGSDSPTCTTNANPTAQCKKSGTCSNRALSCTADAQCTAVAGKCSAGKPNTTSCSVNSDCDVGNTCGSSQNNGTTCDPANVSTSTGGACIPLKGTCSVKGNACNTAADCALSGFCSIETTKVCFANSDCANQPGAMDPATARCDSFGVSGGASGDYTKTLLADANGGGKTCRRNNHSYPDGTTASQTNYPSGKFTTPIGGENTAGLGCHSTDRYVGVPRHYWKTEIEWCDKSIATAGDKWLGYGTPTGGSCQAFKDASHVFPRFYQFGAAPGTDNDAMAAFARIDLVPAATYTHTWTDDSGVVQTVTRTYAQEMTNYANWFAYYRTRLLAVKTVTSLAFLGKTAGTLNVDDTSRVGFHTMFSFATSFVDIADFDAAQKTAWAKQLMDLKVPLGQETPTLNTISRIGDYYLNGSSGSLPGSTDPIVLSCQKNWHMFFTDGFTNQNSLPTTVVGDQDDTVPATIPVGGAAVAGTGLTASAAWPAPFREDVSPGNAVANSAADYVTNYWITNLRPAMPENVATSARDPASWPHQNFAAMSLGTEGILPSGNQSVVEAQLAAGALQWPKPQPTVFKPDQSGVDDLWHAAINGRGRFVNAQSADELKLGMGQILQDVLNQAGARAGASFQSISVSGANNFIYRTAFQPGWGVSLRKVQIDPATGDEVATVWDASTQLALQLTVVPGVKDTPWFTERKIATVDETATAVPFLDASIGANQLDSLAPGKAARAKAVLAFLRGDRSREGTKVGQFRVRVAGVFGDVVDSQPVYVGPPRAPYLEANDPGYTTNFANLAAFKTRPARVYVGANDGMLHAIDDATGNEAWAFVPSILYRPDDTGLGALSYQDGALPPFKHHYYVDATPRISDVNFGGGSSDWHSILVGGLGKGGQSYYALDVSQPNDITSETELAKRVLWQFSNPDLGYTFGRAIVAKTRAFGGAWLVIVPSGYNNVSAGGSGEGKVFFLRASDGALLKTMSTGAGSTTDPSGLAQIAAYQQDFRNQLAEQIYGGDLQGNLWRFDVSDADDSKWSVDKIAQLTDPSGNPQPVTTPPQIEIDISNGIDRWVFVGTGRLLDDLDLTTASIADQIQTMYAFRDGTVAAPITPWPATLQPRTDMAAVTDAAGLAAKPDKGWYDDLPLGQRIIVPVQAALSLIAYVGTSPQTDPCLTGQPGTLYAREYGRGNSLLVDDTGKTIESLFEPEGIVGLSLVTLSGGSSDTESGGFPDLRIAITAGSPGVKTSFVKPLAPNFAKQHRMSWRLLGQ
ncbi:MAG TPA: PilC/PilY family type IV pilus protein [Casimicrobiaceae bacterium]|nr:PilC/PilY family type IV pilus protein [Casimicrobiaceae bacterium]